jgi:hypothetical protein
MVYVFELAVLLILCTVITIPEASWFVVYLSTEYLYTSIYASVFIVIALMVTTSITCLHGSYYITGY